METIEPKSKKGKKGPTQPPAFQKRVRRHVSGRMRDYFVIVAPGFEACCRLELIDLGIDAGDIRSETGGVTFAARFEDCQRANLYLRTATRVLMRIGSFTATNIRQLKKKSAGLPWEVFLPDANLPGINVSSRRSRLYHTEAISQGVLESINPHFGGWLGPQSSKTEQTLFVRLVDDQVTLSLDSSGEPLYKRGLKRGPALAPIRESLAAAILMTAGYDSRRPLVDPMSGSGTFSLEAAMLAKHMAPGMRRRFAFMDWPAFRNRQWSFLKREAEARQQVLDRPRIFASDMDGDACKQLSGAIRDNGLSDAVTVAQKDVFDCHASQYGGHAGLVVVNPPYGVRIGSKGQADDLFQRLYRHLQSAFSGWDVALIAPGKGYHNLSAFPVRRVPLLHGGLRLTLLLGTIP